MRFEGQFIHETEKALLYRIEDVEHWFPKSHVSNHGDDFIVVSRWIALQKDLVDEEQLEEEDYDEEQMADTCHPGHPSNYGDQ